MSLPKYIRDKIAIDLRFNPNNLSNWQIRKICQEAQRRSTESKHKKRSLENAERLLGVRLTTIRKK